MKILVAQIIGYGSYGKGLMLEELQNLINKNPKAEIYYLTCSNTFNACYFNPYSKPEICYLCKKGKKNSLALIEGNFSHIKIEDILRSEDKEKSKKFVENITNINFDLTYENFKVGESALSTYISNTRDRDLEMVEDSFTNKLVCNAVSLFIGLKRFCKEKGINEIYNFNGRHIYNRAVMDIGLTLGIPLYNVELPRVGGAIEHFKNVLPHNIKYKQKFYNEAWENPEFTKEEKIRIASEYFNKRRSGTKVNALSFTETQQKNSLPEGVDYSKETVILYTSSDDEFAAVGKEFSNPYFQDQNEGVFYVANLFNDLFPNKNLIIRIHPNFAGVDFAYARKLKGLKGKYQNVFLVEAESNIDSYALMDIANTVITFGSSITCEATYWDKPVILLGKSFFSGMNIAYEPEKIENLKSLLEADLLPKPKLGSLKFGYYLINGGGDAEFYNRDNNGNTYFKGKKLYFYSTAQLITAKLIKYINRALGIRILVK